MVVKTATYVHLEDFQDKRFFETMHGVSNSFGL